MRTIIRIGLCDDRCIVWLCRSPAGPGCRESSQPLRSGVCPRYSVIYRILCGPWGSFLNTFAILTVAGDTVLPCTAGIGKVGWPRDAKLVCPVYGAAGDFISDGLSNRPNCAFDVSGQRVIDVGFVGEYDFNLCAVGKRLRNHHEGLRIGSKGLVRGSRSGFAQCLREIGGSIYIAPATLCYNAVSKG